MPAIRAFYCVAQYTPDAARAESANVGVLLLVPSLRWMEIRVSASLERVRQFFEPSADDLARIRMALDSFVSRVRIARDRHEFANEVDLAQFIGERADAMNLTMPRLCKIDDPWTDLDALYDKLVSDCDDAAVVAPDGVR